MSETKLIAPSHVGIILDGNRRWAKENNLPSLEGHRRGSEVFRTISLAAFDSGVKYLSAYVFSTENWQRTKEEVNYLMKLVIKAVEKYLADYQKKGIKLVIVGDRSKLSREVLESINKTQELTKNNARGTLVLGFNYGGQQEILDATKKIINSSLPASQVTKEIFEQNLYAPEVPEVDLLIRTSGELRTSGFMLWRSAYAELVFSSKLWPDYTVEDFKDALDEYYNRHRRFGG